MDRRQNLAARLKDMDKIASLPPQTPVAIIGAGYAGLACAVELARHGAQVTVFERSLTLGGRARTISRDGWKIDNGQHILIGAYHETARLLRLTGVSPKVFTRLPLTLHMPNGLHLQAARLPAPWHLAVGVLRARGLDFSDKAALLRLMRYLKKRAFLVDASLTVTQLLHASRQTANLCRRIWVPLCVAALNTPAEQASAQIFANVLRDSLAADAAASELLLPRTDLSELFPVQAVRYLATRRGRLNVANPVGAIRVDAHDGVNEFRLDGDPASLAYYAHVVIATAPYHAAALLKDLGPTEKLVGQIEALPYEPITTVYLALGEETRLPYPMIAVEEGPAQWVFDRGQLGGPAGLLACVISAHGPHEALSHDELEIAVHQQLEQQLARRLPAPVWTRTINEKRASLACRPGLLRPGIRTPVNNLWLAGDYLDSPYPATLESAVRSGVAVAEAIARAARRTS